MKVLLVDVSPAHRKTLRLQLHSQGHDVVEAGDGLEALKLLKDGLFDIMISDILISNMDGYRLCFDARLLPRLKNLSIILYRIPGITP